MTTIYRIADQLDAVVQMAEAHGWQRIYDSGPCGDGRLVMFADQTGARDYLHGKGDRGRFLDVRFDRSGQVQRAVIRHDGHKYADTDELAEVNEHTPAHRLYWALTMIDQQRLDGPVTK